LRVALASMMSWMDMLWWRWSAAVGLYTASWNCGVTLGSADYSHAGCPSSALQRAHSQAGPG